MTTTQGTTPPSVATTAGLLGRVVLGQTASESSHGFRTEVDAEPPSDPAPAWVGDPGRGWRAAAPLAFRSPRVADLTMTLRVDPVRLTSVTLLLWGSDVSPLKTMLLVDGQQASYRTVGDHEPIDVGTAGGLPGRFFTSTQVLPLALTQGREHVEVTLRTYAQMYRSTAAHSGREDAQEWSRRFFEVTTHLGSLPDAPPPPAPVRAPRARPRPDRATEAALVRGVRERQIARFEELSRRVDDGDPGALGLDKDDEGLRFYAATLHQPWSPAVGQAERARALRRVLAAVDHYVAVYLADVRTVATGGRQSDWGGYQSALGEALYVVEDLIADDRLLGRDEFERLLEQPFPGNAGTGRDAAPFTALDGGPLTRRAAWERTMKASFDFARSRLSYISNQVMYTYEGAWKAHEGLRVLGSPWYEGKERSHRILAEAFGLVPFLGEEVLEGPDGEDLDLRHSLFRHDRNLELTDDYRRIVLTGGARSRHDADGAVLRRRPYGSRHHNVTRAGLMRENHYVGVYGESLNYLPTWYFRIHGHAGDAELAEAIAELALRNLQARSWTRCSGSWDGERAMLMQQVVDGRNSAYPGRVAYGCDAESCSSLAYVGLARHVLTDPGFAGERHSLTRDRAREAIAWARQMALDGWLLHGLASAKDIVTARDLRLLESWEHLGEPVRPGAGRLLPMSDPAAYTAGERTELGVGDAPADVAVWSDPENALVVVRDGDTRLWVNLVERNNGFTGVGRAHVMRADHDAIGQVPVHGVRVQRDHLLRGPTLEERRMETEDLVGEGRPFAHTGELVAVCDQPGVGATARDNDSSDTPYSGLADALMARAGRHLVALNTTSEAHGNAREIVVDVPSDARGELLDLVTGTPMSTHAGLTLAPGQTAVLRLPSAGTDPLPETAPVVVATADLERVGLSWSRAASAVRYEVLLDGRPVGRTSDLWWVSESTGGATLAVRALSPDGTQGDTAQVDVPARVPVADGWSCTAGARLDVHEAAGGIRVGTSAAGPAEGDDADLERRDRPDDIALRTRLVGGTVRVHAAIRDVEGLAGVIVRDDLSPLARYAALVVREGRILLATRSRDHREDIGIGNPGQDARGGEVLSPRVTDLADAGQVAHLRLTRHLGSHVVVAETSADGESWRWLAHEIVPMPGAVHVGLVAAGSALLTEAVLQEFPTDALIPSVTPDTSGVIIRWPRPAGATTFDVEWADGDQWRPLASDWRTEVHDRRRLVRYRVRSHAAGGAPGPWVELTDAST